MIDVYAGWIGVCLAIWINMPQLVKIVRTREVKHVSKGTYLLVILTNVAYLYHSIEIRDWIFITANVVALLTSSTVLLLLWRWDK